MIITKGKAEDLGISIVYFLIPFFYGLIGLFFFFFFLDNILIFSKNTLLSDYWVCIIGFIFGFLIGIIQGFVNRKRYK